MEAVLIYPHQLFEEHPALAKDRAVYLVEDPLYFSQYKFHTQKLILHRASMKAYADSLKTNGYTVCYVEHTEAENLDTLLTKEKLTRLHIADVVDNWLTKKIVQMAQKIAAQVVWYDTPQFLLTDQEVKSYWKNGKHLQQAFYIWQRKRLGILIEDNKPVGGKWSFDADNRKRLPKGIVVPYMPKVRHSTYVQEAKEYVGKEFTDHYGNSETFAYATTHAQARACLDSFLQERFTHFGAYEDAMSTHSHTLFHSILSPYLNIGLLTPHEVLTAVLSYAKAHKVPLASVEGFVRQLIGWREFIRIVYICDGTRMRNQNVLGAHNKLTEKWWNATTEIVPIDHAIETLTSHAYTHHIVRLMVVGNAMALLGVDPEECYRWFMEWYIDAYDWVMVPNVYGMALFADGGSMVTKPYISSSRYILNMSDYPTGEWTDAWDALYWNYVDRHRDVLLGNVRAGFSVRLYDRFSKEKQAGYKALAAKVCGMLTA